MGRSKKFEPGEIAVLLHSGGGRIMVVHEVVAEGVIERVEPSRQKYVDWRHFNRVLKVKKPEDAHELIGRFELLSEMRDAEISQINERYAKLRKYAAQRYEVWEDDDESE